MKKNYSIKPKLSLILATTLSISSFGNLEAQTSTFNYTGGIQTYTVPCGVDSIFIQAWGAQGGSGATGGNSATGGTGALGGYAEGWLLTTPGDILNVFVGGQGTAPTGGFNGGGNGGSTNAGGGGGASDVRFGGTAESNRLLVAGGGGGGGRAGCEQTTVDGGNGGNGGGDVGQDGADAPTSGGVAGGGKGGNFGAIAGASGPAGQGCGGFLGQPGGSTTSGSGANGGAGQSCCCFTFGSIPGGGGGGGGYIGGGAGGGGSAGTTGCSGNDKGAGGGGGGGTSYIGGVINGTTNNGVWLANGQVTISWTDPTPPAHTISGDTSVCLNDTISYSIPADANSTVYTWTVPAGINLISGQNTTSVSVVGVTAGNYMIYVQGVNGNCSLSGPVDSIEVVVYANPVFSIESFPGTTVCNGDSLLLNGNGSNMTFVWNNGISNAVLFAPTTSTTYTVVATDNVSACQSQLSQLVTVNPLPNVGLTSAIPSPFCGGQNVVLTGTPSGGSMTQLSGPSSALTGTTFNASAPGSWNIEYEFTDANGCTNTNVLPIVVDCMLGLEIKASEGLMNAYPNPTTGNFTVSSKDNINGIVQLYNELGQLVYELEINGVNSKQIELKNIAPGTYQLKITSNGQVYSGKMNVIKF
ncbi:MAG: T9SS type A sorting domain-containing protein [Fluviicola sp.]